MAKMKAVSRKREEKREGKRERTRESAKTAKVMALKRRRREKL